MTDFRCFYTRRAVHGAAAYECEPGECRVYDSGDSEASAYFYRVPRGQRRAFRAWLAATLDRPVSGAWPYYVIEERA